MVATLLDRLDVDARRALQAAATLGERAPLSDIDQVAEAPCAASVEPVFITGLASAAEGCVEIHALVRALVEASTPAEVRRELHQRALAYHAKAGSPVEVCAEHAARGSDGFTALLVLEKAGAAALGRGDPEGAARYFRRGLERSHRELVTTGDDTFDVGVLSFTRKLAEALLAGGHAVEAEGVVGELVGSLAPTSPDRAALRLLQASVAARRGRPQAAALFANLLASETLDVAARASAELQLTRLRLSGGDRVAVQRGLERSAQALAAWRAGPDVRAPMWLELGELAAAAGDAPRAREALETAAELARASGAPAIEARALGARGELLRSAGRPAEARGFTERAAALAADAGDLESMRRFVVAGIGPALDAAPPSTAPAEAAGRVVLVVEDDAETQQILADCLGEEGFTVYCASTGKQALRLLSTIARPVAILVDLMMPVMNGWDLLAWLREHPSYGTIPVTVVSAFANQAPKGVDALSKPLDLHELLRRLEGAAAAAAH